MPVQFSLSPVQSAPSPCKSLHAANFIATDVPSTLCTLATYVRYGMLRVPSCDCVKYCTIEVFLMFCSAPSMMIANAPF